VDVLIAGAGPTGLTLACALLERRVPVHVVDSADRPATTSRALGLQPRGIWRSSIASMLLGDLAERGIRTMSVTMYAGDRPILCLQLGRWLVVKSRPPATAIRHNSPTAAHTDLRLGEQIRVWLSEEEWANASGRSPRLRGCVSLGRRLMRLAHPRISLPRVPHDRCGSPIPLGVVTICKGRRWRRCVALRRWFSRQDRLGGW
jgi:FAD binding domain